MKNDTFSISTTIDFNVSDWDDFESTGNTNLDVVRMLFEYLFTTVDSLKDKNKYTFLFLQSYILQNDYATLNRVLLDEALHDLHPSLLKSILIMTEGIQDLSIGHSRVSEILASKIYP